jgi:hypothetical protein
VTDLRAVEERLDVVLAQGRVAAVGTPAETLTAPTTRPAAARSHCRREAVR